MPLQSYVEKPRSRDELACIYAALILADDDVTITAEKLTTLCLAANVDVESIWPQLFARALQGADLRQLIVQSVGVGAGGTAAPTGPAEGGAEEATEEKKEGERKEEPEEESSDEDMGLGLFD